MTTIFTTGGHKAPAAVLVKDRLGRDMSDVTFRGCLVPVPGATPPVKNSVSWKSVEVIPVRPGEVRVELLPEDDLTGEFVMWVEPTKDGISQPYRPYNDTFTLR